MTKGENLKLKDFVKFEEKFYQGKWIYKSVTIRTFVWFGAKYQLSRPASILSKSAAIKVTLLNTWVY